MRSGRLKSSGDADDKDEDEDEDAAWLPRAMSLKSCEAMPGRKLRQRVSTSRREGADLGRRLDREGGHGCGVAQPPSQRATAWKLGWHIAAPNA